MVVLIASSALGRRFPPTTRGACALRAQATRPSSTSPATSLLATDGCNAIGDRRRGSVRSAAPASVDGRLARRLRVRRMLTTGCCCRDATLGDRADYPSLERPPLLSAETGRRSDRHPWDAREDGVASPRSYSPRCGCPSAGPRRACCGRRPSAPTGSVPAPASLGRSERPCDRVADAPSSSLITAAISCRRRSGCCTPRGSSRQARAQRARGS
jgi:hypothetical protein